MLDTSDDLIEIDSLLRSSMDAAGSYLRSAFSMPAHCVWADELVSLLDGRLTVALSTVTRRCEPRVSPVDAFFVRGRFHVPSVMQAARTRNLTRNRAASLTCFSKAWAVICHGESRVMTTDDSLFVTIDEQMLKFGLSSVLDWGDGVFLEITPRTMFTWKREPGRELTT